jgi:hypothetical protein
VGKSRSQISQQLVTLLRATSVFSGSPNSAFESVLAVENYLAGGFSFPIAVVQTLEARADPEVMGRFEVARFKISVAGSAVTEASKTSNLASGGQASSEHALENLIRDLLAGLNVTPSWSFVDSVHGFQGEIEEVGPERLVPGAGKTFAVAEIAIAAYNATRADT